MAEIIIHNSITLFEIIICFQLFVCQVESVFLASFIRSKLTTPCCFFLLLDLALVEAICYRKDLQEDRSNIAKGTTDPRVEFISQVSFPNPLAPGSDIQIHVSWEKKRPYTVQFDFGGFWSLQI